MKPRFHAAGICDCCDAPEAWTTWPGVTCVECPRCAFTFDACHTDADGGYSCPACGELELIEAAQRLKELCDKAEERGVSQDTAMFEAWQCFCAALGARKQA